MSLIDSAALDALAEMAASTPPGDFLEVGVYRGGSAMRLSDVAEKQGRVLYLCDTFRGIPERTPEIDRHEVGDFGDVVLSEVRGALPRAVFIIGDARETLAELDTGPLAFVHLDCDQYATYRACISYLLPRMVRGGVMWFDDVYALPGARQAVEEAFGSKLVEHVCQRHYVRT